MEGGIEGGRSCLDEGGREGGIKMEGGIKGGRSCLDKYIVKYKIKTTSGGGRSWVGWGFEVGLCCCCCKCCLN